jgi:hypothetical protein
MIEPALPFAAWRKELIAKAAGVQQHVRYSDENVHDAAMAVDRARSAAANSHSIAEDVQQALREIAQLVAPPVAVEDLNHAA